MPPLVTISSPASGRRPCSASLAVEQVLAHARRAPRTACTAARPPRRRARAARRSRRARRSGTSPGSGSRPSSTARRAGCPRGSRPAPSPPRWRVRRAKARAKSAIDAEVQRARARRASSAATCSAWFVRSCSASPARLGGEDRALGAADRLRGRSAAAIRCRRRDQHAVVVAEHDVAGRDVDAAAASPSCARAARDTRRARARRGAAREDRQPDRAQPAQVAAEAVGHDARRARAGAPRWRTARRSTARVPPLVGDRRARRRARPRRARSSPAGGRPRPRR